MAVRHEDQREMVPPRVLRGIERRLTGALKPYEAHLTPAHQKVFRPFVLSVLRSTSCYVSDAARGLSGFGGSIVAREDKLLGFIHSPKLLRRLRALKLAHSERIHQATRKAKSIRIYADLSDLSKPYAKVMDALDVVPDRSSKEKHLKPGYWLNEVYVSPKPKQLLPVVVEPFSTKEEGFRSRNDLILKAMRDVYAATENRGTWISDRGYDSRTILAALLDGRHHFVIRANVHHHIARGLTTIEGKQSRISVLARAMKLTHPIGAFRGHEGSTGRLGWQKVWLPRRNEELTLVVFWDHQQQPLALLTNRPCNKAADAMHALDLYFSRWWGAEDPVRFLKQAFHVEKFLVDDMNAIRAWFFIIMVAWSLLFSLQGGKEILRWINRLSQPFRTNQAFPYYRLLRGLIILLSTRLCLTEPEVPFSSL